MITFTRQDDGTFAHTGELATSHGRFQWQKDDGSWDGGWSIEELPTLLERMNLRPLKYSAYRITEAKKLFPTIAPTCYGCGMIAGNSCGGYGQGDPLIDYDENHQFTVSIPVIAKGANFGKAKSKSATFNSVACANLELLRLTQWETGTRKNDDQAMHQDHDCQTVGQLRSAQGFKRCPVCKKTNKTASGLCGLKCEHAHKENIDVIISLVESVKAHNDSEESATPFVLPVMSELKCKHLLKDATVEQLQEIIRRYNQPSADTGFFLENDEISKTPVVIENSERRATKLAWWIQQGEDIHSVRVLNFISELTSEEESMSAVRFFKLYEKLDLHPKKIRVYRCENRMCGAGRDDKGNRVRAAVKRMNDFCSKSCRVKVKEAAKQRLKYPSAVSIESETPNVAAA